MNSCVDIIAATNPAHVGLVLYQFVLGYEKAANTGPEFSLAFLPTPLALSERISQTFQGTNASTGLVRWYLSDPSLQMMISDELRACVPITRNALIFALNSGVLVLRESGRVNTVAARLKKQPRDATGLPPQQRPLSIASRLGQWCGRLGTAEAVFSILGVRP